MSVKEAAKTRIKPLQTKQRFLRLPLDEITTKFLDEIKAENPYFNELDALRFVIGKQIKLKSRTKMTNFLNSLPPAKHNLSEDEIYKLVDETL